MLDLGYNERRALEIIRSDGPIPRVELGRRLSVSAPTMTRLTGTLIDHGLIREAQAEDPPEGRGRGKPSTIVDLNGDGLHSVGVFFDPDEMSVCVSDLRGNIRAERRMAIGSRQFADLMTQASTAAEDVLAEAGLERERLVGCGLSFPGHFSKDSGRLTRIPQFADWRAINAPDDFQPYFNMPVHHENDGKAAALNELYYGVGKRRDTFVLILLTYGIGGGIVMRRSLYRGAHRNAAEFGGIFPKSRPRPSGQDLCDHLRRNGLPVERLSEIGTQYVDHPLVEEWVEQAAEQLRMLVLMLARTVDPGEIVIGGTLPVVLQERMRMRILEGSLGEDFLVEAPEISVTPHSALMHRGAATIPLYRTMTPGHYPGRALKGWR
ncbi:ROK family transcriptional regulator [Falsirhodobacter sp. alg1]|uniref:ROK family transcriptional regulator n=1 Tax=Falsirhodobacter sp. alg1 TaxID=1472418 RepID=UPI0005F06FA3|nr:ROK family transcriptional regulator [Falsirhodobacter sp. alg1]